MSRTAMMTIGFLFVFAGIQLNFVESYVLTPRMTEFLSDKFSNDQAIANLPYAQPVQSIPANTQNSPYQQAGYQQNGYSGSGIPGVQNVQSQGAPNFARQPIFGNASIQSRVITPPRWICWPIIFLGAVIFLNGVSMNR